MIRLIINSNGGVNLIAKLDDDVLNNSNNIMEFSLYIYISINTDDESFLNRFLFFSPHRNRYIQLKHGEEMKSF